MKKLVIIDGKSVFYRGYYAMGNLSLEDGTPTGGVYGFASLAFEVIRKLKPDYVVVAWDKKGTSTAKRSAIYPEYKAGRKKAPDDFYEQIPLLKDFLKTLGWPLFETDGYEADDILGTLAVQANKLGVEANLITSDLDMLQLIDENTKVFAMKRGFSDIEEFDLEYFENKYGLKQSQFLDLKALQGDSSDNIPGVPGIGPKTATQLLQEFFTLEGIYENLENIKPAWRKKLEDGKDLAFMSKKIAEIFLDAPVELNFEDADIHNFNYEEVLKMLRKLEFNSLVRKIPKEMKTSSEDFETKNGNQIRLFEEVLKPSEINILPEISAEKFFKKPQDLVFFDFDTKKSKILVSNFENIAEFNFMEFSKFADFFKNTKTVFFNAKEAFHKIFNAGSDFEDWGEIYDIEQLEFLLNALIRDKSLSGIYGEKIDEDDSKVRISAMRIIFERQQKKLEDLPRIREIAEKLDFPMSLVLFKMEKAGVEICPEIFAKMSVEFAGEISKIEKEIFEIAGREFNVASPLQLSKVLFEDLSLPTKGIKKSKNGFSTGQKELDKLREYSPIVEKIEQFREFSKLKSTYVDALPKLADEKNRIHSNFAQDVTTTGRLSSSNPNLQNIPIRSELGRRIREGFVAKKGNLLVSADYSQFELRLAAVLANDKPLIETFEKDLDIHAKTASEVFGVPIDEVSKEQRRVAKIINFSVLYGVGAHNLSGTIGVGFYEAKKYIEEYFNAHKPIRELMDNTLKKAQDEGFVETFFGRRRPMPDIKSSNFMIREMAKRAAQNMPIQGTEADLMKRAMLAVDEKIVKAGLGEQILQIHDSILVEVPAENAENVAEILKQEMESVAPELNVKLKVEVSIGKDWLNM
ncbi:MAG: DNA polymerase I [Candidatus Saccharimonas sp.]|nr:MAG: DNA polymerase I [Candidatus Saccharimonas sp.]